MQLHEDLVVAERYRLIKMIGQGGMGSVWKATHLALDRPCAIKFIEGEISNVPEAHARFEREAKAAAALNSPHVVQIIDHGVWQGRPYIAMELLEGEELSQALTKAGGKLTPGRVNMIVRQVCRALTRAHQAGIVHRDLKPENIFLVDDDDRQLVKILDFGVAKQTSQAMDSNTKTGAMLGTPYFMSPEQAQGIKGVDARSDLWSLAVIVYLCLTGTRPFDSEALGDLLVKIIVQPIPVPSRVAPVPGGFDAWWARAASRNPDHRFQTAKEFASSLALALGVTAEDPNNTTKGMGSAVITPAAAMTPVAPPTPTASPGTASASEPPRANIPMHTHALPPQAVMAAQPAHPPGLGGTGNPATFSGVEPPAFVPKKGPPVAIVLGGAGLGVAALIGIIVVATHKPQAPTSAASSSEGTSLVAASAAAPASAATTAEARAPTATASAAPSATATAVAADTAPSASPPAHATAAVPALPVAKAVAASPPVVATPAKPPGPKTAPTASHARPSMGDDRKW
jgi:serine/threonine-protein kinase